jgi:hypothetical protein
MCLAVCSVALQYTVYVFSSVLCRTSIKVTKYLSLIYHLYSLLFFLNMESDQKFTELNVQITTAFSRINPYPANVENIVNPY